MARRYVIYLSKIKSFIKLKRVRFLIAHIHEQDEHGLCLINVSDKKDIIIVLDPRKEFLATLVHECLHGIFPKYKEEKILALEDHVIKNASSVDLKSLLFHFGKHAKLMPKSTVVDDVT